MSRSLSVTIAGIEYSIQTAPHPLDGVDAEIDHDERVIWIAPTVLTRDRPAVFARAVAQACAERAAIPMVELTE